MIKVNLLSVGRATPSKRGLVSAPQRSTIIGMVMLLGTVAAVGAWWWNLGRQTAALNVKIVRAEGDLARLKSVAKLVDNAIARKAELSEKLALIDRLRVSQRGPVTLLATVSRSIPDGLWLMELTEKGPSIQVEGRAASLTAVTDFVERLQNSGQFDRPVEIVTTSMEPVDELSVVRFAIKAQAAGTSTTSAPAPSTSTRKGN
jgi:type IV pilus assembly protein PilN